MQALEIPVTTQIPLMPEFFLPEEQVVTEFRTLSRFQAVGLCRPLLEIFRQLADLLAVSVTQIHDAQKIGSCNTS